MEKKNYLIVLWIKVVIAVLVLIGALLYFFGKNRKQDIGKPDTEFFTQTESRTESQEQTESRTDSQGQTESRTESQEQTESQAVETVTDIAAAFYREVLSDAIKMRITGVSCPADDNAQISYEELAYVHVLYYDFHGEVQAGELVCNQAVAEDMIEIFQELYENQYPIEKIRLVDEYGGDDDASMEDNNTSCFNYRTVEGTNRLSKHAYGLAIDINPLYNPYITTKNGQTVVSPENGSAFADRSREFAYKIDENDLCYRLFTEHGFTWGGSWKNSKDYQHFQKELM